VEKIKPNPHDILLNSVAHWGQFTVNSAVNKRAFAQMADQAGKRQS